MVVERERQRVSGKRANYIRDGVFEPWHASCESVLFGAIVGRKLCSSGFNLPLPTSSANPTDLETGCLTRDEILPTSRVPAKYLDPTPRPACLSQTPYRAIRISKAAESRPVSIVITTEITETIND